MAVPAYGQMCRGRTCVEGCGIPLGIAQIVGALADNPPLPRLVRACPGIHWAPGRHSVAPGVGAGPVEGKILAGVPGGVGPVLLAGAGCKHKALSDPALSSRTSNAHGSIARACACSMESMSHTSALVVADQCSWHMPFAQQESLVADAALCVGQRCACLLADKAHACGLCRYTLPCQNP